MPKMKTHRGAAKRLKFYKSGKVKRNSGFTHHNTGKKSGSALRRLSKGAWLNATDANKMKQLVPYK